MTRGLLSRTRCFVSRPQMLQGRTTSPAILIRRSWVRMSALSPITVDRDDRGASDREHARCDGRSGPARLRLAYVDALRALCALYVVAQHTWLTVRYHAAAFGQTLGGGVTEATAWMTFGYY